MDLRAIAMKLGMFLLRGLLGFLLLSTLMVVTLRWLDPPMSSFMIQHWVSAWAGGSETPYLHHEWVGWEAVAPDVPLAVVAAEDQRFPHHRGFDLVEIEKAWNNFRDGGRLRGASTISQQVAKNLFLWRGQNLVRKEMEQLGAGYLDELRAKVNLIGLARSGVSSRFRISPKLSCAHKKTIYLSVR